MEGPLRRQRTVNPGHCRSMTLVICVVKAITCWPNFTDFWLGYIHDGLRTVQCVTHRQGTSRLQISRSKCLRVIGNFPRRTPKPRLHTTLNVIPVRDFIYHLTANFFVRCPAHPNPLVRSIGNYSLADLHHQYKKYIHKRPKHVLL